MRGIYSDLKRDCSGSDKRYSFHYPPANPESVGLAVFEAPIDTISHVRLFPDFDGHRLSLGGTSDVALAAFLDRNPQINRISLCLDADDAGQEAAMHINSTIAGDERFIHIRVTNDPPRVEKDYNAMLIRAVLENKKERQRAGYLKETGITL